MERHKEFAIPIERCPSCGASGSSEFRGRILKVPYFGEIMETLVSCSKCNLRHADVMCLGEHPPMRYEFLISSDRDMSVRVVRSSTGTIKVPELGVTIEPGPASQGYVSNVEGVLNRIEEVLKLAIAQADEPRKKRGQALIEKLQAIRQGKLKARLILMDPFGHSAIVDERAKKRKLKRSEILALKAGPLRLRRT